VWMTALVEEVIGEQSFDGSKRHRPRTNPPQD
jgi:hypothetical protein